MACIEECNKPVCDIVGMVDRMENIIDQQEIEDSGAQSVTELLRSVTGVHVSDGIGDGGNARIDMRGFGGTAQSNVAVMINGRKINPATDSGDNTIDDPQQMPVIVELILS